MEFACLLFIWTKGPKDQVQLLIFCVWFYFKEVPRKYRTLIHTHNIGLNFAPKRLSIANERKKPLCLRFNHFFVFILFEKVVNKFETAAFFILFELSYKYISIYMAMYISIIARFMKCCISYPNGEWHCWNARNALITFMWFTRTLFGSSIFRAFSHVWLDVQTLTHRDTSQREMYTWGGGFEDTAINQKHRRRLISFFCTHQKLRRTFIGSGYRLANMYANKNIVNIFSVMVAVFNLHTTTSHDTLDKPAVVRIRKYFCRWHWLHHQPTFFGTCFFAIRNSGDFSFFWRRFSRFWPAIEICLNAQNLFIS